MLARNKGRSDIRWFCFTGNLCPIAAFYFVRCHRLRRIAAAARLRTTAIKKLNAKSVLHMLKSSHSRKRNPFLFCDFFLDWGSPSKWHNVTLRIILTSFVIATAPCGQAQTAAPSKEDARKVLRIISSDRAKIRTYCQMTKLGHQVGQANETGDARKFDHLLNRIYELGKKLGPEYAALVDGLQDIDPESEVGQEISSTLDALDNLCRG
jgi:hypothetical protein